MKKIISLLAIVCLICCMFPVSAFAASDTEYICNGLHTGIWYSNPATKDALDSCSFEALYSGQDKAEFIGLTISLNLLVIDIYDDLLLTRPEVDKVTSNTFEFCFKSGTIRCNNCRAFDLYDDNLKLTLNEIVIQDGNATCADDDDMGYGGAIYVDGADCKIWASIMNKTPYIDNSAGMRAREEAGIKDEYKGNTPELEPYDHPGGNGNDLIVVRPGYGSYIENCYARYGGAIAVCGHDCNIESINFQSNTGIDNGGNDLYVYWGDCTVTQCTFDKEQEGAAAYITADTYFKGCNITKDMCVGDVHQVFITNSTASLISEGNLWIVIAVSLFALGGIVAVIIVKKKKRAA